MDSLLKERILSKNTRKPLNIKDVALLSGSLLVTDSEPLTISKFIREKVEHGY